MFAVSKPLDGSAEFKDGCERDSLAFNVSFGDRCVFSEDTGRAASCAGSRTNLGTTRPTKSLSVAIAPLNDVYKYTIERGYILSHIRRDYSPSQTCHNSPKPAHFVCGSGVGHVGCPFGYCH